MSSINRKETRLIIQHAIAAYKEQGKNQKQLAIDFELEPTRISEAKEGKHQFTSSQLQELVDKFGYPRRKQGKYVKAELCSSIDELLSSFESTSKQRLSKRLTELFSRKDYLELFLSHFEHFKYGDKQDSIVLAINTLCEDPSLSKWFKKYKKFRSSERSCFSSEQPKFPTDIFKQYSLYNRSQDSFSGATPIQLLIRLLALKELYPQYQLGMKEANPLSPIEYEIVLIGDVVLNSSLRLINYDNLYSNEYLLETLETLPCTSVIDFKLTDHLSEPEIYSHPDSWGDANLSLYLNGQLEYHLLIEFSSDHYELTNRNVIVKNIDRTNFLVELEKVRKWLHMPEDFMSEIKSNVAKAGGYVPGAMII
ncbi:hypothetical protein D5R81_12700 [Parashewanella spongiae]|uniref:Uncharacterized protein n=1 Tax=Parashewanella spongiae TaxID=342950 RepID=A0A3A6TMP2_9GAMM|nr:hypothetical protein [Parashewanella spongiae]MCL1078811.1 hypothetical protein [Parashewanella spongiae]RJY11937.1 hypothetical protein D5R81_12700 [Parashewanella spongiae]